MHLAKHSDRHGNFRYNPATIIYGACIDHRWARENIHPTDIIGNCGSHRYYAFHRSEAATRPYFREGKENRGDDERLPIFYAGVSSLAALFQNNRLVQQLCQITR